MSIRNLAKSGRAFMSPLQVAEYVGVTRRTIYHHMEKGALHFVKIGGVIRISLPEVLRYTGEDRLQPR